MTRAAMLCVLLLAGCATDARLFHYSPDYRPMRCSKYGCAFPRRAPSITVTTAPAAAGNCPKGQACPIDRAPIWSSKK